MIKSFFQSLKDNKVEYLLISGQATVLYGAATFSEDIDIWINPTDDNRIALLKALQYLHATYYKLTPPLTEKFLNRGHGFHFYISGSDDIYLDVMGKPPRVPDYEEANDHKNIIRTDWGRLPTIGIRHLVELKKTQRLADYAIISRLSLIELAGIDNCSTNDFEWALNNIFTLSDLNELITRFPGVVDSVSNPEFLCDYIKYNNLNDDNDVHLENKIEDWLTSRMLAYQRNDREYWRNIISELKTLRTNDELMINGTEVKYTI